MERHLFIIVGAAGTGKSTVQEHLRREYGMAKVITHTTRHPRTNEKDGRDYYFETPHSFAKKHYLESVHYSHAEYGSSREGLERAFNRSKWATIILDSKGAETYLEKATCPMTILYLYLDDVKVLQRRMLARGDDPQKVRERITSSEFTRDRQIPRSLQGKAEIIHSDDLSHTQQILAPIIERLGKH